MGLLKSERVLLITPWLSSWRISWWMVSAILSPVHRCGRNWHLLFFNPQQPHNGRVLWETRQNGQLFNFFRLQSSYAKGPPIPLWVLEIPSPQIVYPKDARSLRDSYNGVLLPVLPSEAHFSLQYTQLLGPPCHSRNANGLWPFEFWWH